MKRNVVLLVLLIALAGCANLSPSPNPRPHDPLPPDTAPSGPIDDLEDQLRELGIDHAALSSQGRKLDDTLTVDGEYSPLGMTARISPKEIFAAGLGAPCARPSLGPTAATKVMSFPLYDHVAETRLNGYECYRYETANFALEHRAVPQNGYADPGAQSTRTVAVGDFDGDGLQEGLHLVADLNVATGDWYLRDLLYEVGVPFPDTPNKLFSDPLLGRRAIVDLEATAADMDGNGLDDLVIAIIWDDPNGSWLGVFVQLQIEPGVFEQLLLGGVDFRHDLPPGNEKWSVRLAAGNLDLDPQDELVVVLRSFEGNGTHEPDASARYWVFDDPADAGGSQLRVLHEGTLAMGGAGGPALPFLTADAVVGDLDGDGLGELAFTGILGFPLDGDPCEPYTLGYVVYEDLAHTGGALRQAAALSEQLTLGSCDNTPGVVYEVFAHAFDHDGGYTRELLANDRVFKLEGDELRYSTSVVGAYDALGNGGHFSEATVSITVGDFDNDGFEDVAVYDTATARLRTSNDTASSGIQLQPGPDFYSYPQLLAYDDDVDGLTLQYDVGSHRVVLTEPMIIAALAAPPYDEGYGQDPLGARTSYGTSTSSGSTRDTTVSFSVNAMMGITGGIVFGPIEMTATYEANLSDFIDKTSGTGYETTYTNTFETAGRDAVVFTSFPYDAYDYTIVASYDSDLLGETFTVMLPRQPVTRIVSATYYDDRVPEGSFKIGQLFRHTAGDVDSYMSRDDMVLLKGRVNTHLYGPAQFLDTDRKTVGQGVTSTSVSIELSQEKYYTEAVGFEVSHTVSTVGAGPMTGFTIGEGESNSVTISSGESTVVAGTVPSIRVDDLTRPEAVYDFGMFTYMHRAGNPSAPDGQLFQVVNFWVD